MIEPSVTTGNFYRIQPSLVAGNKTFRAIDLLSIDQKIDDGMPDSGFVRSGRYFDAYGIPQLTALPTCSSATKYLVENKAYECVPFFRIGGIAGNPQ